MLKKLGIVEQKEGFFLIYIITIIISFIFYIISKLIKYDNFSLTISNYKYTIISLFIIYIVSKILNIDFYIVFEIFYLGICLET